MSWVAIGTTFVSTVISYDQQSDAQQAAWDRQRKRIAETGAAEAKREREREEAKRKAAEKQRKTADSERRDARRGRASTILTQGTRDYGLREQKSDSKTLKS